MKMKTSIYQRAFAFVLLIPVIFYSCIDRIETKTTNTGGQVKHSTGVFVRKFDLYEFEYKGHTYISCNVREGIVMTHAGHCWCNGCKK
jgi:hypothetical protein